MKNFLKNKSFKVIVTILFFIFLFLIIFTENTPTFNLSIEQKSYNIENNEIGYSKTVYFINDNYMVFTSDNNSGRIENDEYLYIKYFDTEQEILLKNVTYNKEIYDVKVAHDKIFIQTVSNTTEPMSQGILSNEISYFDIKEMVLTEKTLFSEKENVVEATMMKMYTLNGDIFFNDNEEIYSFSENTPIPFYTFSDSVYTNYIPSNYNKQLATLGFRDDVYRDVQIYDENGLNSDFVLSDDITYPNVSSVKTGVIGVGKITAGEYNFSQNYIFYVPFSNTDKYVFSEDTVYNSNSIYTIKDTKYNINTALLYEFNDIAPVKKFILATVYKDKIYTENLSIDFLDGAVDIISNENVIYIYQKDDLTNYAKITINDIKFNKTLKTY